MTDTYHSLIGVIGSTSITHGFLNLSIAASKINISSTVMNHDRKWVIKLSTAKTSVR